MSEEWGPWIEHDGSGCPCRGEFASVIFENKPPTGPLNRGRVSNSGEWVGVVSPRNGDGSWLWENFNNPVIRYRIRKPRGMTILEGLLENLPDEVPA